MNTVLRFAAGAFVCLQIGYILLLPYLMPGQPAEVAAYQHWWVTQPLSDSGKIGLWLGQGAAMLGVISAIALMFLQRWARLLFLLSIIGLLLAEYLIDLPVLKPGSLALLDSTLGILAGVILALSYSRLETFGRQV